MIRAALVAASLVAAPWSPLLIPLGQAPESATEPAEVWYSWASGDRRGGTPPADWRDRLLERVASGAQGWHLERRLALSDPRLSIRGLTPPAGGRARLDRQATLTFRPAAAGPVLLGIGLTATLDPCTQLTLQVGDSLPHILPTEAGDVVTPSQPSWATSEGGVTAQLTVRRATGAACAGDEAPTPVWITGVFLYAAPAIDEPQLCIGNRFLTLTGFWTVEPGPPAFAWSRRRARIDLAGLWPGRAYRPHLVLPERSPIQRIEVGRPGESLVPAPIGWVGGDLPLRLIADTEGRASLVLRSGVWRPVDVGTAGDDRELGIALGCVFLFAAAE